MNEQKTKIKRITLVDQIAAQLCKEIILLKYPPNSNLPSETELMNRFEASRLTIRSTLQALANEGLIEIVHGRRSTVKDYRINAGMDMFHSLLLYSPEEITTEALYTFRKHVHWLYGQIYIAACRKAQPYDEEDLWEIIRDIGDNTDFNECFSKDLEFCRALLRISNNIVLMMLHNSHANLLQTILESERYRSDIEYKAMFYPKFGKKLIEVICSNNMEGLMALMSEMDSTSWKAGANFYKKIGIEV